ncbi:MAG: hypothetical protein KKD76_02635 [Verrucomicrobia bacterium]|nr:hypothetical protein [Verrucomicrobiota bacterium]
MLKRRWLRHVLSGVAAMVCGLLAVAEPAGVVPEYPLTPPRVYQDKNLEAVAMPIGGIGTGTIWLDGAGRLQVWQIFNNFDELRVPDSFFAVRVQPAGGAPVVRVLETMPEQNLMPVPALTYEGGYPMARLNFTDPQLPVTVRLEAFNPMIPLNTDDSSLPCAIFRWTVQNSGKEPAKVTLLGTLRNAKGDRNRVMREGPLCAVSLDKADDPVPTCHVKVRKAQGAEVPGPQIQWLAQTPTLNCLATMPLNRIAEEGGAAVVGNIQPDFFNTLALLRSAAGKLPPDVAVFEDFERDDYAGWTITGQGFGKAPSTGTASAQQPVYGFAGRRLVNTYANGRDQPQGTARSKPFKIEKKYIGFLIGGGNNPNPLLPGDKNPSPVIFADFEKGDYTGWTITGTAFSNSPSTGTAPGQNPVSGFEGKFLINTFANGGDLPQGTATSMPFILENKFICFLVGGGADPEKTYINLRVGGQVVRTAIGRNRETLEQAVWDVSDLKGKEAVIEIVDKSSGSWGHINADRILFTDVPVGETCFNLYGDGRLVRSATGRNVEELQPVIWDVADLAGKEGVLEIVDRNSGSWGHVNVDQVMFADQSPETVMKLARDANRLSQALTNLTCTGAEAATLPAPVKAALTGDRNTLLPAAVGDWPVSSLTRLKEFHPAEGYRVLAATPAGEPLLIDGPLEKGRVLLALAPDLPWAWGAAWLAKMGGIKLRAGERLTPGAPGWGSLVLAVLDGDGCALPRWNDAKTLTAFLDNPAAAAASADAMVTVKPGETLNAALAVPFTLAPGQSRTVTFAIAWHFPNVQRFGHAGNYYCGQWPDAAGVARYLAANLGRLWEQTRLYHDTLYQSNLPEEFLDAMTSQSVIVRGPTCFRSEDGYFGGYEGCYGCCPLNCSHVWNYAQSHARLFPEIGRNMRVSDFITYLHPDGETSHRQHEPCRAFIDGHCGSIEAALREYQLSADTKFLEQVWPGVKKAVDWMIAKFDPDHDGVTMGQQANTYDCNVSGANTFIGSQYLSALAAAERMALVMKDGDSAARWQTIREAGMKNQNERLWNGEYYFQIPEVPGGSDYNNGCHADQLLGQWWAHQLNLGYLYPPERIKKAMETVMKENFRTTFAGFEQKPRRYIPDDEGGLLMCTWPKNDRPQSFTIYADEVWTGIEYSTAGAMICEGMMDEARRIVKMARSRYDGRLRPGLNSGPGGNPFNELECGKFYARAMSSWGLLITSQGLVLEGPKGILGFKPRWQPAAHRSFYTAPEGWGLFVQNRRGSQQVERIEVRYGRHRLHELVFELPEAASQARGELLVAGRPVKATLQRNGREARLQLAAPAEVSAGQTVEAMFNW